MERNNIISIFIIILGLTLIFYGINQFQIEKLKWLNIDADIKKINIIENEEFSKYAEIYYSYKVNKNIYNNKVELKNISNLNSIIENYRTDKIINIFYNKHNISQSIFNIPYIGINFIIMGLFFFMVGSGIYFQNFY